MTFSNVILFYSKTKIIGYQNKGSIILLIKIMAEEPSELKPYDQTGGQCE